MKAQPLKILSLLAAAFGASQLSTQAAILVAADDFDSYSDTSFIVVSDGTNSLLPDGGGGNAIGYSVMTPAAGGFFASGFDWIPVVQPGPGGPNTSTVPAEYTVSFDLTITSAYIPANGIEIWFKDQTGQGDPEGDPSASLYAVATGGFTTGVTQSVSFTLENPVTTTPFGYTEGSGFMPHLVDEWRIRMNGLDFGSPTEQEFSFQVDNFQVTVVPEPSAFMALLAGAGIAVLRRRRA